MGAAFPPLNTGCEKAAEPHNSAAVIVVTFEIKFVLLFG